MKMFLKWIPVALYVVSFFLPAYVEEDPVNADQVFPGYQAFALCFIALISTPIYFLAWLANVCFVVSLFVKTSRVRKLLGAAAIALSLIPLADLYARDLHEGLRAGYFIWCSVFVIQMVVILFSRQQQQMQGPNGK